MAMADEQGLFVVGMDGAHEPEGTAAPQTLSAPEVFRTLGRARAGLAGIAIADGGDRAAPLAEFLTSAADRRRLFIMVPDAPDGGGRP
jgi:hypothetical protein